MPPSVAAGAAEEGGAETAPVELQLFRSSGDRAGIGAVVERALEADVVYMGERHGDPAAHALQLQLLEALIAASLDANREIVLSLEMFERDVQLVLDEYLAGLISEEHFLAAARPWPQYRRDYRPLVERAREEGLRVVAANAPRRYVNRVSRLGVEALDELPPSAKRYLPALPFPGPSAAYRAEWDALMAQMGHGAGPAAGGGDRALQAQALWDAAMAEAIHRALGDDGPGRGPLVLHLAGSFHIQNRTGTPEALRHYRPGVRDVVVTTRPSDDPTDFGAALEGVSAELLGDFILLTPRASAP